MAYNRHTKQLAPSWPDTSTGGALHWYCRGQGSNPTHDQARIKISSSLHKGAVTLGNFSCNLSRNTHVTETNNLMNNAYLQEIFVTDWTNLI